jgi:Ca-activated chloride channel family protein
MRSRLRQKCGAATLGCRILRAAALVLLFGAAAAARAETFGDRINHANATLRSGNADGALNAYRELQVERPESDTLYYNIGCAQYQNAEKQADQGTAPGDKDPFDEARASFQKSLVSENPLLRENGEFNAANCVAQTAKLAAKSDDRTKTIQAFKDSIQAYEDFLHGHPGHDGARTNLDHMRYLLKKMLQNPPKEQQGGDDQKNQENQKQNQDPSQDKQGDESKDKRDQDQDQQDESEKQPQPSKEKSESEGQKEKEQPQSQQGADETAQEMPEANPEQQPKDQNQQAQSTKARDRQAIEALLQSLENQDQREQVQMRKARPDTRVRGDWW